MKRIAICLAVLLATFGAIGSAFAEEPAAVTNYKKAVEKELSLWVADYRDDNEALTKAAAERAALMKQDPKPADYDKRLQAIEARMKNAEAGIKLATDRAVIAIGLLEVPQVKKNEADGLLGFVETVIKAKGIPLNKNMTIAPTANWKQKSIGIKITFQSKWF